MNVGVAAHITSAAEGGPRFDPTLNSEQRSEAANGIWLCQTCAKLVDNDTSRFPVQLLLKWKIDAESRAMVRIGRAAQTLVEPASKLKVGFKYTLTPIIPREHERSEMILESCNEESLNFLKGDSGRHIEIPSSFIVKVHAFTGRRPGILELGGRLQWVSRKQHFELFPEAPSRAMDGRFGVPKDVDVRYPAHAGLGGRFAQQERIPDLERQGWC